MRRLLKVDLDNLGVWQRRRSGLSLRPRSSP